MEQSTKYQSVKENLIKVRGWARDGLSQEQIAKNLGINKKTLQKWRQKYPEFKAALVKGKDVADREVENALFKSATGFEYEEITWEKTWNKELKEFEMIESKRVRKFVPPVPVSGFFWLKNRKPDTWRDVKDVNVTGQLTFKVQAPEELLPGGDVIEIAASESPEEE